MLQLSPDRNFHFELLRVLASVRGAGGDVAELLNVCDRLVPGDFESWYREFHGLAKWVESTIEPGHDYDKASLRDTYLRVSRYHFASQFFLHSNENDPRLREAWERWVESFDKAGAAFEVPAERKTLKADGFEVPVILLRASADDTPRPVVIAGNGLDGSMEELLHYHGLQALERGYHVVLYEGPGQCTVRRQQKLGFIHDWERVVTPVVDYLETLPFVDPRRISLMGISLGGYLAARAAAFEHRLYAVILLDGLWDMYDLLSTLLGNDVMKLEQAGEEPTFINAVHKVSQGSTHSKWLMQQISWACKGNIYQAFQVMKKMSMKGIAHQIQCPVFIGHPDADIFVELPQPEILARAVGDKATLRRFTVQESADAHCHVGATSFLNQVVFEWLKDPLKKC